MLGLYFLFTDKNEDTPSDIETQTGDTPSDIETQTGDTKVKAVKALRASKVEKVKAVGGSPSRCDDWCFDGSNVKSAGKDEMGLCKWKSCNGCKQCSQTEKQKADVKYSDDCWDYKQIEHLDTTKRQCVYLAPKNTCPTANKVTMPKWTDLTVADKSSCDKLGGTWDGKDTETWKACKLDFCNKPTKRNIYPIVRNSKKCDSGYTLAAQGGPITMSSKKCEKLDGGRWDSHKDETLRKEYKKTLSGDALQEKIDNTNVRCHINWCINGKPSCPSGTIKSTRTKTDNSLAPPHTDKCVGKEVCNNAGIPTCWSDKCVSCKCNNSVLNGSRGNYVCKANYNKLATKSFKGECTSGREILMYSGKSGSKANIASCAKACYEGTKKPLKGGGWNKFGKAKGFILNSKGRCWCENAYSIVCKRKTKKSSYTRYDFPMNKKDKVKFSRATKKAFMNINKMMFKSFKRI